MWENVVEDVEQYEAGPGNGCILAHAMGLGKTFQSITLAMSVLRFTSARKVPLSAPEEI